MGVRDFDLLFHFVEKSNPWPDQACKEKTTGLSEEVLALLRSWSLVINMELRVVVCTGCGQGVEGSPKGIVNHLQKRHAIKRHPIRGEHPTLQSDLARLLQRFHFSVPNSINEQPADRAPVAGIKVHQGWYCPVRLPDQTECRRAYPARSSLEDHLKKEHGSSDNRPKPSQLHRYPCDCQTIFLGSARRYFKVKTGLKDGPGNLADPYSAFIKNGADKIPDSSKLLEEIRAEELPSLLRATQWHEFLGDHRADPEDIIHLIHHPVPPASN